MIPKLLLIKGINSYQQEQRIDFDRLIAGQLFGIFGAVGSGKSTLLEAITLALYGQTERLNQRDNRNYNLMNLRSDELVVDFTFRADDKAYRCYYALKRHGKDFEKVRSPEHHAYVKEQEDWVPITLEAMQGVIGLSYQNFKRTIIIPQGRFQEFLQLGPTDRTRMMKEVFGLEKYDLSYQVKALKNQNELALKAVEGGLAQFANVNEVVVREKQRAFTALKQTTKKQLEQLNQLKTIKQAIDKQIHLNQQVSQAKRQLTKTEKELKTAEEQWTTFQTAFAVVKTAYDQRETTQQKIKGLQDLIALRKIEQAYANTESQFTQFQTQKTKLKSTINTCQKDVSQQEQQIFTLKENRPDIGYLTRLNQWFAQNESLQQQIKETEQTVAEINEKTASALANAFQNERWEKLKEPDFQTAFAQLAQDQLTLDNEVKELLSQQQKLSVDQQLTQWASALEPGQPCPLCGATHHPDKYDAQDAAKDLKALHKKLKNKQAVLKANDAEEKRLLKLQSEWEAATHQLKTQKQKLSELRNRLGEWQEQFPDGSYSKADQSKVKTALEAISKSDQEIKSKEKTLQQLRKKLDKLNKEKEAQETAIHQLDRQRTVLLTQQETLQQQLNDQVQDERVEQSIPKIEKKLNKLQVQHQKVVANYENGEQQRQSLQERRSNLLGNLQANQSQCDQLEKQARENIALIQEQARQLEKKELIQWIDQEDFNAFHAWYQRLEQDYQSQKEQLIREQTDLENLQKALVTKSDLAVQQEQLQKRAVNIDLLSNLFRSSGFVDYVSSIYLKELCHIANERFYPLTRQRLKLEIDERNNFIVRDFLNQGRTRHAKTLSGGQLFQAALSLALALAENIGRQAGTPQPFFFIDEGFGTQDEASLQLILKTLKSLRQEGRCVGVISHVETLKQEIDVFLAVENDELLGSRVRGSWEGS